MIKDMGCYKLHECSRLPRDVQISYSDEDGALANQIWELAFIREATEADLEENHYLNMVGEITFQLIAEITHCPYCGFKLSDQMKTDGDFFQRSYDKW